MGRLTLIGAASSAGAYGPGQERAPHVFREHGLVAALGESGLAVVDAGDVASQTFTDDPEHPTARNVETVAEVCGAVADAVAAGLAEGRVLVLGGDCTVELGTVAGATRDGSRVGLVYVDLDTDLNTPLTGDGILDWMGVAHLLGVPGSDERLSGLEKTRPLLPPDAICLFAADNSTAAERALVERLDLYCEPLSDVLDDHRAAVDRVAAWAVRFDRLLVHVDADVLDFTDFPIAENTRTVPGLPFTILESVVTGLMALPNSTALTVCEINPDHARDERTQFAALIRMLVAAYTSDPASRHH
jgi:arginase